MDVTHVSKRGWLGPGSWKQDVTSFGIFFFKKQAFKSGRSPDLCQGVSFLGISSWPTTVQYYLPFSETSSLSQILHLHTSTLPTPPHFNMPEVNAPTQQQPMEAPTSEVVTQQPVCQLPILTPLLTIPHFPPDIIISAHLLMYPLQI